MGGESNDTLARLPALVSVERVLERERIMRIGQLAAITIGIGVLTGCPINVWDPSLPKTPCTTAACQVNVVATVTLVPFSCTIDVQPKVLDVSGDALVQTITWTFTFDKEAIPIGPLPIVFDSNAQSVITNPVTSSNSITFKYKRPSTGGNHYGYAVTLPASGKCSTDPWVVD